MKKAMALFILVFSANVYGGKKTAALIMLHKSKIDEQNDKTNKEVPTKNITNVKNIAAKNHVKENNDNDIRDRILENSFPINVSFFNAKDSDLQKELALTHAIENPDPDLQNVYFALARIGTDGDKF